MALPSVTEANFEREVLQSDLPVLVEFGAEWCGPCKVVAPELDALAAELKGKAKVVAVDIDRSPMLAQQMGVRSVPAFVVFNQGQPVGGKVGALKRTELRALIEQFLPRAAGALKPNEVQMLFKAAKVSLVDVREGPVFARAHIEGAVSIPLEEIETRLAELHMLPTPAVLYCRAGDKTKDLAEKLNASGLPVAFMEGGVLAWEAAGFRLVRPN